MRIGHLRPGKREEEEEKSADEFAPEGDDVVVDDAARFAETAEEGRGGGWGGLEAVDEAEVGVFALLRGGFWGCLHDGNNVVRGGQTRVRGDRMSCINGGKGDGKIIGRRKRAQRRVLGGF